VTSGRVRARARDLLRAGIAEGVFPGAVAAVWRGRERVALTAAGDAVVGPRRVPMRPSTIFDLASLTKPLATAASILHLWAGRRIDVGARVADYLPAFAQAGKETATISHLMAHSSGLPAWQMLYLPGPPGTPEARQPACRTIDDAVIRICATRAEARPGARDAYSDLGFIALGHLVRALGGMGLDAYARRHIFLPLGMRDTRFVPPRAWRPRIAATEYGNAFERARAAEQHRGRRFPWRARLLRGEVHDGNAWYAGGGVAGHAGLFGTAADLGRFGRMALNGGSLDGVRVLPRSVVAEALGDHSPVRSEVRRGLGWVVKRRSGYGGRRASPSAFGHTGFTGTSILADPERDAVIVLLTNRVHPVVRDSIVTFRPRFYDAILEALDA
jgi:CubicO group peptidase (beta-lactamase class C family)